MIFNQYDTKLLKDGTVVLRALAHPTRIAMLNFICENQETQVQQIHTTLKLDQSLTSQHLKVLRDANLVQTRRSGKKIFYSVDIAKLKKLLKCIKAFDKKTIESRKKK